MDATGQANRDQLLKSVAEQIKLPLMHIARQAELSKMSADKLDADGIMNIADMTIKLIDSYLLSMPGSDQTELALEPVSLASVLNNTANNIRGVAKLYNCDVELQVNGKYAPVMSNAKQLEAAFTMLGFSFLEAHSPDKTNENRGHIYLTNYRTSKGLVAGVFSPEVEEMSNSDLGHGIDLTGRARQILPNVSHSTGAGVLMADSILRNIASNLRVAHYRKMNGLAATLSPSQQLRLIA